MLKKILLAIVIIFLAERGMAQQYEMIDSLKKDLKTAEGDLRTHLLYDLAWEYRKSHPDSTLYYCREIITILQQKEDNSCLAKCYNFMGIAYHYKGDDVQAFDFYNLAIDSSMEAEDSLQYAHSLNNLGRMFLYQGDFVKSYDNIRKALLVFQKIDDTDGVSYAYKSLSEIYQTQQKYLQALSMSRKTVKLRAASNNTRGEISALNDMALIFQSTGSLDSALFYYQRAEKKAMIIDDAISLSRIYMGKSQLLREQKKYDMALAEAMNAKKIVLNTANINLTNEINLELAKIYYAQNNVAEAKSFALGVINSSERSENLESDMDSYLILANIEERNENHAKALRYFQNYANIRANLENSEAARTIERLEARIEIENKERENEILLAEKRVDQALIDRQRLQNILLTVAVLTALFFLVMLYLVNTRRRATNAKLREKNTHIAQQREEIRIQNLQIAEQNEKLKKRNEKLAAINNEKDTLMNILAHDLKAPFNRVHGIGHLIQMSDSPEEEATYLKMLFAAADNGLNLIRDLLEVNAHQGEKVINVSRLDAKEILTEKVELFRSEARSKDIKMVVSAEDSINLFTDKPYLGRILDNLISNAIKFSKPGTTVKLGAGVMADAVYISIADEGPGFTKEDRRLLYNKFSKLSARPTAGESSNGLGLAIVKLLVETLDGEIILNSTPGKGSEFIIKFPLRVDQEVGQDS